VLGRPSVPRLVLAGGLVATGFLMSFARLAPLTDAAVVTAAFLGLVTFDALRYGSVTRSLRLGGDEA
jgi:hypothetical protein